MATYTYLVADLLTNKILAELPLAVTAMSRQLSSSAGQLSGTLAMGDPAVAALDVPSVVVPGRTALYVDRDGTLVWGGIIWDAPYSSVRPPTLTVTANTFESFWDHQQLTGTANYDADYWTVVKDLMAAIAAMPGGNIGLVLPSGTGGGNVTVSVSPSTYYTNNADVVAGLESYGSLIQSLAQGSNAFEYTVEVYWDTTQNPPVPAKRLVLGNPYVGRTVAEANLVADYPGNVISYTWDPGTPSTRVVDIGGTPVGGTDTLYSVQTNQGLLNGGWPNLDQSNSWSNITSQAALDAQAQAELGAAEQPGIPTLVMRGDVDPYPGTYGPGDQMRVRIAPGDPYFAGGLDAQYRITQTSIQPASRTQVEEVTVDLELIL